MKRMNLSDMTTKGLVDRFAEIGCAQDQALLGGQISKFNRPFGRMEEVSKELRTRPGDQRRELMMLYDFPNMQVRLKSCNSYARGCAD